MDFAEEEQTVFKEFKFLNHGDTRTRMVYFVILRAFVSKWLKEDEVITTVQECDATDAG